MLDELKRPVHDRDGLAAYALALHQAIEPYYSPGRARVRLGVFTGDFDAAAAELEGFARCLWGLAPLVKGGFAVPFWPEILKGLSAGTDPDHEEYWGDISDFDQRIVESAAISFTLLLVPDESWGRLDDAARRNLVRWLEQIVAVASPPNNWRYFQVLAHLALRSVGVPTNGEALSALLEFLDGCALGDEGWSTDGLRPQADHYVGFAMQFYGLAYARFAREADPGRAARHVQRARTFALQFREWFADDGASLPYGRSQPYRFAQGAFWGAAAWLDASPFSPGETRELLLGNIRWWQRTDMLDRDGVLSIGGGYPNPVVAEFYTSAQSPYWAFKAFLPLALAADHPFWTAPAATAPSTPAQRTQPVPGMILQRQAGDVVALTAGQEAADRFLHTAEKYGKFAYSTRYGFCVERDSRSFETGAFDNMLAVSRDKVHFGMRKHVEAHGIVDGMQYARWRPLDGVCIETVSVPTAAGHMRLHRIESDTALFVAEGGFAIRMGDRGRISMAAGDTTLVLDDGTDTTALRLLQSPGPATLQRVVAAPGSHFYFPRAVLPQLRLEVPAGTHVLANWFGASTDGAAIARDLAEPMPADPGLFAYMRERARPPEGWRATAAVATAFLADRDRALNGPTR